MYNHIIFNNNNNVRGCNLVMAQCANKTNLQREAWKPPPPILILEEILHDR